MVGFSSSGPLNLVTRAAVTGQYLHIVGKAPELTCDVQPAYLILWQLEYECLSIVVVLRDFFQLEVNKALLAPGEGLHRWRVGRYFGTFL